MGDQSDELAVILQSGVGTVSGEQLFGTGPRTRAEDNEECV
jgi:hypothetical protein